MLLREDVRRAGLPLPVAGNVTALIERRMGRLSPEAVKHRALRGRRGAGFLRGARRPCAGRTAARPRRRVDRAGDGAGAARGRVRARPHPRGGARLGADGHRAAACTPRSPRSSRRRQPSRSRGRATGSGARGPREAGDAFLRAAARRARRAGASRRPACSPRPPECFEQLRRRGRAFRGAARCAPRR